MFPLDFLFPKTWLFYVFAFVFYLVNMLSILYKEKWNNLGNEKKYKN